MISPGRPGRGTEVRVDPVRHIANEGSVTCDRSRRRGRAVTEILTGLPRQRARRFAGPAVCRLRQRGQRHLERDRHPDRHAWSKRSGSKPQSQRSVWRLAQRLGLRPDGRDALRRQRHPERHRRGRLRSRGSRVETAGLIPVGWFPGALAFDAAPRRACAWPTSKGIRPNDEAGRPRASRASIRITIHGSLSLVPAAEAGGSARAFRDRLRETCATTRSPPACSRRATGQPARPVPERIGEPSVFKHVVYIIKENRTYDQVLGRHEAKAMATRRCAFSAKRITPNQHKLVPRVRAARQHLLRRHSQCRRPPVEHHRLRDRLHGEDPSPDFPRSYPDGMGEDEDDALAYCAQRVSSGTTRWPTAARSAIMASSWRRPSAGATRSARASPISCACYRAWKGETNEVIFESRPMVESLAAAICPRGTSGWEMNVPDQFRADFILRELKEFEAQGRVSAI